MAASLNSVLHFNSSKLRTTYKTGSQSRLASTTPKAGQCSSFFFASGLRLVPKGKTLSLCLSVANSDQLTTDNSGNGSKNTESVSDQLSSSNPQGVEYPVENGHFKVNVTGDQKKQSDSSLNDQSIVKKTPLKPRERLRAARVLNRYTDSKSSSSSQMGSRVLDAIKESERGKKRSRLPEAPSNLFDDTKRGMPKQGWTFQFPGGTDLFLIVLSFVLISTLMFATTFLVWKVGAIHFNEY